MKIVIIGGVAGGATAAARIRRLNEKAEIIIFEKSGYVSYANCGLPYFISDTIKSKDKLTLQTPSSFKETFNIDVKVNHEVLKIDVLNKKVIVKNLLTKIIFDESYDKLIISTGAKPIIPDIKGSKSDKIFTLRNIEDTTKIKNIINNKNIKRVCIVGAGYIGIEIAENLRILDIDVTLIESSSQILHTFDNEISKIITKKLFSEGINIILNTKVTQFIENNNEIILVNKDKNIKTDLVILAVGVTPDTILALDAKLSLGEKGSILVDDTMRTSNKDIYALGDAVSIKNFVTLENSLISLAGPANKQARIAADNICGIKSKYDGAQATSIIKIFDLTAASTGINELQAKKLNLNYDKVILSPFSHAIYYPNASNLVLKVLFEKNSNRILGAQAIGKDKVDKRIDVIATAIRANMKATDLSAIDLAYAPPYSSAKDPVNLAGYMIENLITSKVKQIDYEKLISLKKDDGIFIDVRTKIEYEKGHAKNFINIPLPKIRDCLSQIPKDKAIYVMCQTGLRSYFVCRILQQNGYNCFNFSGGYSIYHVEEETI